MSRVASQESSPNRYKNDNEKEESPANLYTQQEDQSGGIQIK